MDEIEMMMAGQTARLVCGATGATDDIEAESRRKIAAEREAEAKGRPLAIGRGPGGQPLAMPNPLNPSGLHHGPSQLPTGAVVTPAPTVPPGGGFIG